MRTIGQCLEETLNLSSRKNFEQAFLPLCEALNQTADKIYRDNFPADLYYQRFIRENWQLISFMGLPYSLEVPPNLPFSIRRAVPSLSIPNLAQEIVIYSVRQTLTVRRFPLEIGFDKVGSLQIADEKLIFPQNVLFALIGSIVFHPINSNEKIKGEYWINIRGFQMFISELWGRNDLAERIMNLYK